MQLSLYPVRACGVHFLSTQSEIRNGICLVVAERVIFPHCSYYEMKKTFAILNEMVADGAIENYAIAGAIGAIFYVEPFSTQDIDVFILMPETQNELIAKIPEWDYLRDRGYSEIRGEAIIIEDWPVQFMPVSNALEEEAYLNAETLPFEDTPVRVVLAEHLVAIMLKLGRPKDFARVQMFLSQDAVEREALLNVIERHGLEEKWKAFQSRFLS